MPSLWKEGIIIPLPKPNKNSKLICNYRPISKLSCLAKVFEKIQAEKLNKECIRLGINFDTQFGFRPGLTTNHALFKLTTRIANNLNDKTPTHLVALDFEKAYDTLWIKGLVYKMVHIFKISQPLCKFVLNYLTNRTYKVQVNNNYSEPYLAPAGTAQGSAISCLLYIIYVADFPKHDGYVHISTSQFADDTLISVQTSMTDLAEEELNEYLSKIANYLHKWKIKINENKCEEITILGNIKQTSQNVRKRAKQIELKMNDNTIPKSTNLKYLGVHLTRNFKFNQHLEVVRKKMLAAYFTLKNIFFNRKIDVNIKLLAYKQIIKPIALYAAPIWMQVSKAQINKIATLERKILRACTGLYRKPNSVKYYSNAMLYETSKINPIEDDLVKHSLKFIDKEKMNGNSTLKYCIRLDEDYLNSLNYYKSKPPIYLDYLNELNNGNLNYYDKIPTIENYRDNWFLHD